jgi:excinuclease UvrABC helicase subunit UvrB
VFSAAKVIHNKKKQTFRISPNKEHCFQLNNEP